ncbi:hypothetical protein D3C76_675380 [compost metagenome]
MFLSSKLTSSPGQSTALALSTCLRRVTENFAESKYLASGQNCTVVPVLRLPTVPMISRSLALKPSAKAMLYSLPSRLTRTSTRVDSAFTTEMPTPCRPPENS